MKYIIIFILLIALVASAAFADEQIKAVNKAAHTSQVKQGQQTKEEPPAAYCAAYRGKVIKGERKGEKTAGIACKQKDGTWLKVF